MIRRTALVVSLLVGLLSVGTTPAAQADTTTARALLFKMTVAAEGGSTTYDRSYFRHWIDSNGDCQNTRAEVLIDESRITPTYTSSSRCTVASGRWYSYYDGLTWTNPSDVDIDHVVALKEARESGARRWSSGNRTRFANDLSYGRSLVAVTDNVNSSKGDRDPAQWLPPRSSVHCRYATTWVLVKYRWRLSIDSAERSRLSSLLSGDCGANTVTIPTRGL